MVNPICEDFIIEIFASKKFMAMDGLWKYNMVPWHVDMAWWAWQKGGIIQTARESSTYEASQTVTPTENGQNHSEGEQLDYMVASVWWDKESHVAIDPSQYSVSSGFSVEGHIKTL